MEDTINNLGQYYGIETANSLILNDAITGPLESITGGFIWPVNVIEKTETGLDEMTQKISKDIIDQLKGNYDFSIKPQIEKYHIKHR